MKKYIILGDPVALARPRMHQKKVYDSQRTEKLIAGINLRNQHGSDPLFEGPLFLDVSFFLKIPSSHHKKNLEGLYHHKTPDLSNLLKFIEDIATGVIYVDDRLISQCTCAKYYSDTPRTEFIIKEIK